MRSYIYVVFAAFLGMVTTFAIPQQAVAPPPRPVDSGPSLEATLKFIQDKLNEEGRVNYGTILHADGQDDVSAERSMLSVISTYSAEQCRFLFTLETTYNGGLNKFGTDMPLKNVKSVKVTSGEAWWNAELAEEGHPLWSARVTPPIFILSIGQVTGRTTCFDANKKEVACAPLQLMDRMQMTWAFREEGDANRVAQALTHAVELCGGGNKDPF